MLPNSLPILELRSTNPVIRSAQMMVLVNQIERDVVTIWVNDGKFGKNHPKYLIITYEDGFGAFMPEYADSDEELHKSLEFFEISNSTFCQGIIHLWEDIDPQLDKLKIIKK